jgi:hypothetical protein
MRRRSKLSCGIRHRTSTICSDIKFILKMYSGILYSVAIFRTDVSKNVLSPSSGVLRLIGSHSSVNAETLLLRRMASSGMLRRVAVIGTDVSEKLSASIIRVTRIGELRTSAVTSNRHTLRRNFYRQYYSSKNTVF